MVDGRSSLKSLFIITTLVAVFLAVAIHLESGRFICMGLITAVGLVVAGVGYRIDGEVGMVYGLLIGFGTLFAIMLFRVAGCGIIL